MTAHNIIVLRQPELLRSCYNNVSNLASIGHYRL